MNQDFLTLLSKLNHCQVRFVIIGGFAGVVYGAAAVTQGFEICCEFTTENLLRLQEALAEFHPVHMMTPGRVKLKLTEQNCKDFNNLYLDTDLGQLDCIGYVKGVGDFNSCHQAGRVIEVDDEKFNVLTIEALIQAKQVMNRPRDKETIIQLEAIRKACRDDKA
ncbi:MAG: nucleotidyltransferase [Planctomycetota bacterium]|nr:MAG: nucleotidyltransferase [Planctomycetota bacterium]